MKNDYRIKAVHNVNGTVIDFFSWLNKEELEEKLKYLKKFNYSVVICKILY